jgi:exodeoxyribonuclease VII large subunit
MKMDDLVLSVSDFVAVFNQTISFAYPNVTIEGELESFRISKGKWVYFNLKDNFSSVKFFGTVAQLPGPLEDGLLIKVKGVPFLHHLYGFSINVQFMQPVGEGSLKRAAQLLELQLTKEGLFDESRKRPISYPPSRIGLITSVGSAAYHDFIKILAERWGGIAIEVADVQVQGEIAPSQIVKALEYFNSEKQPVDVIVVIRGGGSADDLAAFNSELVTRAVATSRTPTLVAIGHEVDVSLAEKAADKRGSTPTHAAEILSPDRRQLINELVSQRKQLDQLIDMQFQAYSDKITDLKSLADEAVDTYLENLMSTLNQNKQLLDILSPLSALKRGYAIIRQDNKVLTSAKGLKPGTYISSEFKDAEVLSLIKEVKLK